MSTDLQPPRPPAPPQPPESRSNIVPIALLLLALIVVAGGVGIWIGLRFLSNTVQVHVDHADSGKKDVSIKTPFGSLEVNQGVSEASLGLPIYPGATAIKEHDSATVNIDIADQANVRVYAGKYETPDALAKVVAFYHDRLGTDVTKYTEKNEEGKTVFELKHDKQEKVVALKSDGDQTVIELVHISQGPAEAN